jgi:hypothetical protein
MEVGVYMEGNPWSLMCSIGTYGWGGIAGTIVVKVILMEKMMPHQEFRKLQKKLISSGDRDYSNSISIFLCLPVLI